MSEKTEHDHDEEFKIIIGSLLDYLDTLDKERRVEVVEDVIYRMNFEKRLMSLTEEELEHMQNESLTEKERARLDALKGNHDAYEAEINNIARLRYFRRCAWSEFLNGLTDQKPWTPPPSQGE